MLCVCKECPNFDLMLSLPLTVTSSLKIYIYTFCSKLLQSQWKLQINMLRVQIPSILLFCLFLGVQTVSCLFLRKPEKRLPRSRVKISKSKVKISLRAASLAEFLALKCDHPPCSKILRSCQSTFCLCRSVSRWLQSCGSSGLIDTRWMI